MTTYRVSSQTDPKRRAEPKMESSVQMSGGWTTHAYERSHDGKRNIVARVDGFDLYKSKSSTPIKYVHTFYGKERTMLWGPSNKRVLYYGIDEPEAPDCLRPIVMLDTDRCTKEQDGEKPPHKVAYASPPGNVPYGLEWGPDGKDFYVLESLRGDDDFYYSRIMRVPVGRPKSAVQLVRISGRIDFFMPPTSRFEAGGGPDKRPYWIVFGHSTGLHLISPKGKVDRISKVPAVGLRNVEWHPTKNQLLLFFQSSSVGPDGKIYRGVYQLRIDRVGRKDKGELMEQLYDRTDVHTLWYSPHGKYMTWSTPDAIYYRKPEDPPEKTVKLIAVHEGLEVEIKGVTWNKDERKLAFTAGNLLFIHDTEKPDEEPVLVASFGKDVTHFTAEPIWLGDEVYLTVFEDIERSKKKQTPEVNMPGAAQTRKKN